MKFSKFDLFCKFCGSIQVSVALLEHPSDELSRTWELRELPDARTRLVP